MQSEIPTQTQRSLRCRLAPSANAIHPPTPRPSGHTSQLMCLATWLVSMTLSNPMAPDNMLQHPHITAPTLWGPATPCSNEPNPGPSHPHTGTQHPTRTCRTLAAAHTSLHSLQCPPPPSLPLADFRVCCCCRCHCPCCCCSCSRCRCRGRRLATRTLLRGSGTCKTVEWRQAAVL